MATIFALFMKHIAIFASGSGTNAENIINYFKNKSTITVVRVLCNKQDAKVLDRAKRLEVNSLYFTKEDFFYSDEVLNVLLNEADFIVLAGFLWKIPVEIIKAFPNKIVNIHPALLPKYGGKGMYGMHVHEAVKNNLEKETGITIHYVNENYDDGAIIFQKSVKIDTKDTPEDIAAKVHELEYEYFPKVIEEVLTKDE